MDILKLANQFQKLAQQPLPKGRNPATLPAGSYMGPTGEVTIVGDPNAKVPPVAEPIEDQGGGGQQQAKGPKEVFQEAGWNWEPRIYYMPTSDKDKEILRQKGYQYVQGVGLVPPEEMNFVTQALSKGWKYAGGGFGLVPGQWYDYLKRERYI